MAFIVIGTDGAERGDIPIADALTAAGVTDVELAKGDAVIQEVGESGGAIIAEGVRIDVSLVNGFLWVNIAPDGVRAIMSALA